MKASLTITTAASSYGGALVVSVIWHSLPRMVGWYGFLSVPCPHDIGGALVVISCVHSMPAEESKIDLSKVLDYYCA